MSESAAERPEPVTAETPPTPAPPPAAEPPAPPPPPAAAAPPPAPPAPPRDRRAWAEGPGRLVLAVVIALVAGALVFGGIGMATGFALGHAVGQHQQFKRDGQFQRGGDHMRQRPAPPGVPRTVPRPAPS